MVISCNYDIRTAKAGHLVSILKLRTHLSNKPTSIKRKGEEMTTEHLRRLVGSTGNLAE